MPEPPSPNLMGRREAFGRQLRALRSDRALTQERLGEQAGLDRKTVNRIENGRYSVSLDRIFLIADALDVHPRELFP